MIRLVFQRSAHAFLANATTVDVLANSHLYVRYARKHQAMRFCKSRTQKKEAKGSVIEVWYVALSIYSTPFNDLMNGPECQVCWNKWWDLVPR